VGTAFYNFAFAHNIYLIYILDGGQSMGNRYTAPAFHDLLYGILDKIFGFTVYATGSLIKNEYPGFFGQCPRKGDKLPLTGRKI